MRSGSKKALRAPGYNCSEPWCWDRSGVVEGAHLPSTAFQEIADLDTLDGGLQTGLQQFSCPQVVVDM